MKTTQFLLLTIIAGIAGILFCQLLLPSFVSTLQPTLETLNIVDATNMISWAAIIFTILGIILVIWILSKKYHPKAMIACLSIATLLTIIILCAGSFLYLYFRHPVIFTGSDLLQKLAKFYAYPGIIALWLADPQPIWIVSTILFLVLFNMAFFYLIGGKKDE